MTVPKPLTPVSAPAATASREWFPMRVTYSREIAVKTALDAIGIECFVPMRNKLIATGRQRHYKLVPAIHNLIFLHSTQDEITGLKATRSELSPLRYIVRRSPVLGESGGSTILTIPDRQMEQFLRVASITDDRVIFLNHISSSDLIDRKVRIIDGDFAGIEGVIRRVQRNRRVVVQLEGLAAVAIAFVPPKFLVYID